MIVSHSSKLVVFALPKTGSRTVGALLEPLLEVPIRRRWRFRSKTDLFHSHMTPAETLEVFSSQGWNFWEYRRITFTRNPFSRLVSLYRHVQQTDDVWRLRRRVGLGTPEFSKWLRGTRTRDKEPKRGHARDDIWRVRGSWSLENWVHDRNGKPLVTDILRLEDLPQHVPSLLRDYDLPQLVQLQSIGVQEPVDSRGWYSEESRALVIKRYHWELKNFYPEELGQRPCRPGNTFLYRSRNAERASDEVARSDAGRIITGSGQGNLPPPSPPPDKRGSCSFRLQLS